MIDVAVIETRSGDVVTICKSILTSVMNDFWVSNRTRRFSISSGPSTTIVCRYFPMRSDGSSPRKWRLANLVSCQRIKDKRKG